MKRTSLPLQRREFITLLGGAAALADRGARAAARASAAHRRAHEYWRGRLGSTGSRCGFSRRPATTGLDRRPQRADRHALGRRRRGRYSQTRSRIGCLRPGCHPCRWNPNSGAIAGGNAHDPDRVRAVADPVGAGFVDSLARPGGNATGFANFEYGISGKWLELLKEIAPRLTRVAVLRDPSVASGTGQLGAIQSVAPSFAVELTPIDLRGAGGIETRPNGVRAQTYRRPNCDSRQPWTGSPRPNPRAGGSTRITCMLFGPRLRRPGGLDLLRP